MEFGGSNENHLWHGRHIRKDENTSISIFKQKKEPQRCVSFASSRLKDTHKTTSVGTGAGCWPSRPAHLHGEDVGDLCLCDEGIKECLQRA